MTTDHWQRMNDIFDVAVELPTVDRESYLHLACGDNSHLLHELESLVALHVQDDGAELSPVTANIKANLVEVPTGEMDVDSHAGRQVGCYEVVRLLGKGGMGVVYLARRTQDYRGEVAIKVLKTGTDTEDVVRRFRQEMSVQAALGRHANIAGLLDAGVTDDGLPYFVMEYVDGQRIDRYCDSRRLTVAQRLELFVSVCSAVRCAHQHAVIHRDLKPSNILVSDDGTPKLIDFGIAKLIASESDEPVTQTRQRFLTPQYASPEQHRGEPLTTASDVYSLGVVLYELLTGRRPSIGESQSWHAGEVTHLRVPDKPSSVIRQQLGSSGAKFQVLPTDVEEIGLLRGCHPRQLSKSLAGDLDNVLLRALSSEVAHRYATVDELSADVVRYLNGQPVTARPVGPATRLARWCRLNRLAATLLAALLMCSIAGLVCLSQLSQQVVRTTAFAGSMYQAELIQSVHTHYSDLVDEFKKSDPDAGERLKPPATFTIELGQAISAGETGMHVSMYSDRPFRTRPDGGPKDEFQKEALRLLRANPDEPVYHFEHYGGRPSLRYAVARVMDARCVKCHNSHPDRPDGPQWKVGDVRGVLEVIRPLDTEIEATKDDLRRTFSIVAALFGSLLSLSLVVPILVRRRHRVI